MLASCCARYTASRELIGGWRKAVGQYRYLSAKAAMCIIADEVLTGKVRDVNAPFMSKFLFDRGVDLIRVEVVPDDTREIVSTVRRLSEKVGEEGFVFTSGGIGPTHDDLTYEAIADAFDLELRVHKPTLESMTAMMKAKAGQTINPARKRMATLPYPAEYLPCPDLWVPLVVVHNVYVLPGIPHLFARMVEAHRDRFKGQPVRRSLVGCDMFEGDIAADLKIVLDAHPGVSIGSYPKTGEHQEHNVVLSVEGRDEQQVESAASALEKKVGGVRCLAVGQGEQPRSASGE